MSDVPGSRSSDEERHTNPRFLFSNIESLIVLAALRYTNHHDTAFLGMTTTRTGRTSRAALSLSAMGADTV